MAGMERIQRGQEDAADEYTSEAKCTSHREAEMVGIQQGATYELISGDFEEKRKKGEIDC